MSNDLVYAEVPVGDTSILSFRDGDTIYIPCRHLCEKLGLSWQNEHRRIQNDPILSKAVIKLMTALSNGQEQLCLPLNYLPGWLFKINLKTVNPEVAPRLEMIQRESHQAFYDYWIKGAAINPRSSAPALPPVADVIKLVEALRRAHGPAERKLFHQMLADACTARGLEVPLLEELAPEAVEDAEADAALIRIDALVQSGMVENLHRTPHFIAVRARDIEAHGIALTPALKEALRRHGRFKKYGCVNPRHYKSAWCWVFHAR